MTSTRTTKASSTRQSASLNPTTAEYDGPLPCLVARIGPDVALSRAQSFPDCTLLPSPPLLRLRGDARSRSPLCQCERGVSLFACGCVRNFKCTTAIPITHTHKNAIKKTPTAGHGRIQHHDGRSICFPSGPSASASRKAAAQIHVPFSPSVAVGWVAHPLIRTGS